MTSLDRQDSGEDRRSHVTGTRSGDITPEVSGDGPLSRDPVYGRRELCDEDCIPCSRVREEEDGS